jgi:hypothetical protein
MLFVALIIWMVTTECFVYPPAARAAASNLPSRSDALAVMKRVADYAQSQYRANARAYWDDGVYHIGMMAFYNVSNDEDVLAYTAISCEFSRENEI